MFGLFFLPEFEEIVDQTNQLLRQKKAREVIKLLNKAEKKNLFHPDLFLIRSKAHAQLGELNEQKGALDCFLKAKEKDVLHHLRAVDELIQDQNYLLAQAILNLSKKRFPLSAFPHTTQAKLFCLLEQFEEAAKALIEKQKYGKLDDQDTPFITRIRKSGGITASEPIKALLAGEQTKLIIRRYYYERFESIGMDCEYGFLQRANGREPLGLFRWGAMPLASLIELFQKRFKDFAKLDASFLKIKINPETGGGDYHFYDSTYGFEGHTWYTKKNIDISVTEEDLHLKVQKHFSLLGRKLREEMEGSEKIFLYKSDDSISEAQCRALHQAMQALGPNKLLVVMRQNPQANQPAGALHILEPDLVLGFVDYFWTDANNPHKPNISGKYWDEVIEQAYQHFVEHFPELDV